MLHKHETTTFSGINRFFRRFIRNFASIAKPLYSLLKKSVFFFYQNCLKAFETLKSALTSFYFEILQL